MKKSMLFILIFFCSVLAFSVNYGGDLVYVMGTDAVTLFPGNTDNPSEMVCRNIFEGLVEFDSNMKIHPVLAKSWELSEDGKEYTFHLKENIKFHDGAPLNSRAVKKSLEFIINSKSRKASIFSPFIESIEVIDELTFKIKLTIPGGFFINNLAHSAGLIMSPNSIDEYGYDLGELGKHPVGTGPFSLEEWKRAERITLVKNEDYWGEGPYLDSVIYNVIPEDITRVIQLQSGDADITSRVPPIMIDRLETTDGLTVDIVPSLRVMYLGFNFDKPPFDDDRVRKAINYAIDKEKICEVILRGMGNFSDSPLAPLTVGYYPTGGFPYDPQKAKELLKEAGQEDLTFELSCPRGRYLQDYESVLAIQGMLAEVGITANVRPMEWADYMSYLYGSADDPQYEVFFVGWSPSTGDADWVLRPNFYSDNIIPYGDNNFFYRNEKLDGLIDGGAAEVDYDKRMEIYKEAQEILVLEDTVWGYLWYLNQVVAYKDSLMGVEVLPTEIVIVKNCWFE